MKEIKAKFINHNNEATDIVIVKIEDKKVYFYPLEDINSIELDENTGHEIKIEYNQGYLEITDYYRIIFDV